MRDIIGKNGKTLFEKGHLLTKKEAQAVEKEGINEVHVRSPLTCKATHGICRTCYGVDLSKNVLVNYGEAVGIIAAQAIGEPGTQLTMRTFHSGGIAEVGGDITMGLPRVEEIFERRIPKSPAVVSQIDGEVIELSDSEQEKKIVVLPDPKSLTKSKKEKIEYIVHPRRMILVKVGETVKKGALLTDGSADIAEVFEYGGKDAAENYIINEVNKIYQLQGASISRKHIEVIVRQMFSRRKIKDPAGTRFSLGEVVELGELTEENDRVAEDGGEKAKAEAVVLGISEVALTTQSWLSAASFENTTRILIDTAIRGGVDELRGLKENVIIGRIIPAGTGFREGMAAEKGKKEEAA